MDFQGWEFLSDDGHGSGDRDTGLDPRDGVVDMGYFTCPPPRSPLLLQAMEEDRTTKTQQQAPVSPDPNAGRSSQAVETGEISVVSPDAAEKETGEISIATPGDLASAIYQAFFDKKEESGFVDDIDTVSSEHDAMMVMAHAEEETFGFVLSDEEDEAAEKTEDYIVGSEIKGGKAKWGSFNSGWRLTGAGALRSAGVAAAALCVLLLSGHQQQKQPRFGICTDGKGLKLAEQQDARLREAPPTTPDGAPATDARISFGGYLKAFAPRKSVLDDILL